LSIFAEKFKEVLFSVLPITIIVFILNFTLVPLGTPIMLRFIVGAVLVVIGLSFFLVGVDLGVSSLGNKVGETITRTNKLWIILLAGLVLGFIISIAEPGLLIFGDQVSFVTDGQLSGTILVVVVSIGLAILLAVGFIRIIYNIPLYIILTILYIVILILAIFSQPEILVIAFDASGATTGVLAVPFILSIALGISHLKKDSKASEKDSFGTIAIVSAGAIISVLFLGLFISNRQYSPDLIANTIDETSVFASYRYYFLIILKQSLLAMLPIIGIFALFQIFAFKLKMKQFMKMFKGFIYAFIGLFIFLLAVNAGFMDAGSMIGYSLASNDSKIYILIVSFVLGVATILAEPAVHVLTHQIEDVTSGYVSRKAVLFALTIGVGLAVVLSTIRILVPELQIWHYLLPGYIIALILMYIVPKIFVGIAFDAGGVATGPVTATFILAFMQGAARGIDGADVILDGFGMIAMVALTPIITLQILGFIFKVKSKKRRYNE